MRSIIAGLITLDFLVAHGWRSLTAPPAAEAGAGAGAEEERGYIAPGSARWWCERLLGQRRHLPLLLVRGIVSSTAFPYSKKGWWRSLERCVILWTPVRTNPTRC